MFTSAKGSWSALGPEAAPPAGLARARCGWRSAPDLQSLASLPPLLAEPPGVGWSQHQYRQGHSSQYQRSNSETDTWYSISVHFIQQTELSNLSEEIDKIWVPQVDEPGSQACCTVHLSNVVLVIMWSGKYYTIVISTQMSSQVKDNIYSQFCLKEQQDRTSARGSRKQGKKKEKREDIDWRSWEKGKGRLLWRWWRHLAREGDGKQNNWE